MEDLKDQAVSQPEVEGTQDPKPLTPQEYEQHVLLQELRARELAAVIAIHKLTVELNSLTIGKPTNNE